MHCKKCGKDWNNRVAIPKECPFCKSMSYSIDRVYTKREIIKEIQDASTTN